MKRIVCLLIAALSVSLLLGGCGQNSDPLAIREFIIGDSIGTVEQRRGRRFAIRHCANSGAVASWPESYMDMVRPGIIVYGLYPSAECRGRLDL